MLRSRKLSLNDKRRVLVLATQELEKNDNGSVSTKTEQNPQPISVKRPSIHSPKDTASFLALFNRPDGFKYLTHDYDGEPEKTYEDFLKTTQDVFREASRKYNIPKNLWSLMNILLTGKGKDGNAVWSDFNNSHHGDNYSCDTWRKWSEENPGKHLIENESFKKTIMAFRSTIRMVKSDKRIDSSLSAIIKRQAAKHAELQFELGNLDNADFYTYVLHIENGIQRILDDITRYAAVNSNVKITYSSYIDSEFSLCTIKIVHLNSFSPNSLKEVIAKFNENGGAFAGIAEKFRGYCNWSVESKWADVALRWNILADTGKEQIEPIEPSETEGFTHILTFYKKLK